MERSGKYLTISIFNLLYVFVLVQRIMNKYPNYPIHRLYFGEVETHDSEGTHYKKKRSIQRSSNRHVELIVTFRI